MNIGATVGAFRVEQLLGSGAMGDVYLARHQKLPNTVAAVKVLKAGAAGVPAVKDRFVQEALVAAAVGTHRVARPLDVGLLADGRPYILMEYVAGRTLAQILDERGPLPVAMALRIAHRVADTMAIAHTRGIVHRDLKPSNLMLVAGGSDAAVKILDFGISRAPSDLRVAHTVEHSIIGSPGYMSPEAAGGQPTDAKTDVFSMGVTLFRMLTGELPFPAGDLAGLNALLNAPPPRLAARRPADREPASDAVEELVADMLAKDTTVRPSMAEVRDRLGELYTQSEPLSLVEEPAPQPPATPTDGLGSTITLGEPVSPDELPAIRQQFETLAEKRLAAALPAPSRRWVAAVAGVAVAAAAAVVVWTVTREAPTGPRPIPTNRRLTYLPAGNQVLSSAISPSGAKLAYRDMIGLHVLEIDGGSTTDLAPGGKVSRFAWSGDSTRLFVHVTTEEGDALVALPIAGGARVLIAKDAREPAVSRSGEKIAFVRGGDLWIMTVAAEDAHLVRRSASGGPISSPTWSPDDRRIAYIEGGPTTEILIVDVDGRNARKLAMANFDEGMDTSALAWLADGRIVYPEFDKYLPESGFIRAFAVSSDGIAVGQPQVIASFPDRTADDVSASRDGRRVAYSLGFLPADVYVGDLTPGGGVSPLRPLARSGAGHKFPLGFIGKETLLIQETLLDQTRIVRHQLVGDGRIEAFLKGHEGLGAPQLLEGQVMFWTHETTDAPWVLMSQPVAGSSAEVMRTVSLPAGVSPQLACSHGPSQICVVGKEGEGSDVPLYRFHPRDGEQGMITRIPREYPTWFRIAVSPSGKVAVTISGEAVSVINLGDGTLKRVVPYPGWLLQHVAFGVDDETLYLTGLKDPEGYALFRRNAGGTFEKLRTSTYEWMGAPVISDDGRQLALTIRNIQVDSWLLENP